MPCSSDHPFIIKFHFHYVIVVLLCDYPTSEPSAVTSQSVLSMYICLPNPFIPFYRKNLLNPDNPGFANSADPDLLASDLDLHCLSLSISICMNNLDQVI